LITEKRLGAMMKMEKKSLDIARSNCTLTGISHTNSTSAECKIQRILRIPNDDSNLPVTSSAYNYPHRLIILTTIAQVAPLDNKISNNNAF
jgi:hypothetical protein